ncbi:MAG: hypothetical protein HYY93_13565 [Planctomycetes bacterium]|nr:hypothetical protein [Planctomycetota bacterium]
MIALTYLAASAGTVLASNWSIAITKPEARAIIVRDLGASPLAAGTVEQLAALGLTRESVLAEASERAGFGRSIPENSIERMAVVYDFAADIVLERAARELPLKAGISGTTARLVEAQQPPKRDAQTIYYRVEVGIKEEGVKMARVSEVGIKEEGVKMARVNEGPTGDLPLWVVIRNGTEALTFSDPASASRERFVKGYMDFDRVQFDTAMISTGGGLWNAVDSTPQETSDGQWQTISGGALMIEMTASISGPDQHEQKRPGQMYVSDITIKGPFVKDRKAVMDWVNGVATASDRKAGSETEVEYLKVYQSTKEKYTRVASVLAGVADALEAQSRETGNEHLLRAAEVIRQAATHRLDPYKSFRTTNDEVWNQPGTLKEGEKGTQMEWSIHRAEHGKGGVAAPSPRPSRRTSRRPRPTHPSTRPPDGGGLAQGGRVYPLDKR